MALYCDTPFTVATDHPTAPRCFKGRQSIHLMADTEEELIAYAVSIGMKREWLQHRGRVTAHFDVTGSRLHRVLSDPRVTKMEPKDLARWWMARRKESTR